MSDQILHLSHAGLSSPLNEGITDMYCTNDEASPAGKGGGVLDTACSDTYAPYCIELFNTALCASTIRKTLRNESAAVVKTDELSRVLLPYVFEEIKPGWLMPLNRIYKPVGLCDDGLCNNGTNYAWAVYEDDKYRSLLLPKADVDLSLLKQVHPGVWYCYNDDDMNSPFSIYSTPEDRRKYHLRLWHALRHWNLPLPNISPALLKSAKELGISDLLLGRAAP
jgi:hypothetical protein